MAQGTLMPPETILQVVTETERKLWIQGGVTDEREESLLSEPTDLGRVIIQHGSLTRNIHSYFMGLEQRKCCLLLAACKQRFASVRLVRNDGRDSGIEEGAMEKTSPGSMENVTSLDAVEFQVFQNTIKCAAFPVLGAPDPPSAVTPTPSETAKSAVRGSKKLQMGFLQLSVRSLTPVSLPDSGVEEQEDTALVPSETLCELLRRAFRLSVEKFNHYEDLTSRQMEKKSPQKILAEELVRQLIALENNSNPFYNPKSFINRISYDHWQQKERGLISDLLNKFWHFSLPQITNRTFSMKMMHDQYRLLMERIIQYELPFKQRETTTPPPTSLLSSASVRLLKEFGLRYGVGEQFRKIVYLNYLAVNFDPTVWFIHHVLLTLTSVMESMPTKRSSLIIVQEEFSILESSIQLLELKALAAIAKMKTLFYRIHPSDDVELVIELLSLALQAKSYLLMHPLEPLGALLFKTVQTIFPTTYERHKMVAQDELRQNKWNVNLSPKLLNMLIGNIRDEVHDYKQHYQAAFLSFFNITVEAAQEFYKLLMSDVAELLNQTSLDKRSLKINKLMLSLAYRLNQLDVDWSVYIPPQLQTWRDAFHPEVQQWAVVLKMDMHTFITRAVSTDKYSSCEVQWAESGQSLGPRTYSQRRSTSLTPSVNSAFTTPSSAFSTPDHAQAFHQSTIQEADVEESPTSISRQSGNMHGPSQSHDPGLSSFHRRPSSDPVSILHSSALGDSYIGDVSRSLGHYGNHELLSFTHIRQSSSLPNIQASEKWVPMSPMGKDTSLPDQNGIHSDRLSREVSSILSDPIKNDFHEESTDNETLTEDSLSLEGDETYPPIVEETSNTPVQYSSDHEPVTISDVTESFPIPRQSMSEETVGISHKATVPSSSARASKSDSFEVAKDRLFRPRAERANIPARDVGVDIPDYQPMSRIAASSFTESLISNVSFPDPVPQDHSAVLPVSSSAIDVITMLQRIVGIGKGLCRTITPSRIGYDSDQSSNQKSGSSIEQPFPISFCKNRQKLYECILSAVRSTVCVYADNMVCMDLCGTSHFTARRLAGSRLIEYLQTQREGGLMWGCRHNLAGSKDCFQYLDRRTPLLCDRHEPITRDMCTRINNVSTMMVCLEWFHRRLAVEFGILSDLSVKHLKTSQTSTGSMDYLRSEFIVLEDYGYDPTQDRSEVMETVSQLCASMGPSTETNIMITSPIDTDQDHLKAELRALCRIMAYRLNLFVCDALPVLLSLKARDVTVETGLHPITDFLSNYIGMLQGWLYHDNYRRVLECLWIFIVQDFEHELKKLEKTEEDTEEAGQLLLQALAHLLKFMNNQEESLRRELLLSQAEDVSFHLSLYAMPLSQLVTVFRRLCHNTSSSETSSVDTQYQTLLLVRQRIKHDLMSYRKDFSGRNLITWILHNQTLFTNFDQLSPEGGHQYTYETAFQIGQRLLDWNVIADVDGDPWSNSRAGSPTDNIDYEFPDVTIDTQSCDYDYGFISNALRATPRPDLKASLRAASRSSGQHPATPAFRNPDKSSILRSQKSVVSSVLSQGVSENQEEGASAPVLGHQLSNDSQENDSIGSDFVRKEGQSLQKPAPQRNSEVDPYFDRGSPMSISSQLSNESRSVMFSDSSETFYYVCPFVGNTLETSISNYELFQLVEECFQKKVTIDYIAKIIFSRRKRDVNARNFLRNLTPQFLEKIKNDIKKEEIPMCVSS